MAEKENETQEKPLDKMTAVELREVAKKIPEISGVHAMKKAELLEAIKKDRGIEDEKVTPSSSKAALTIKKKIQALKIDRQAALEAKDKKMATIYRRRISRLKKKSRRAA